MATISGTDLALVTLPASSAIKLVSSTARAICSRRICSNVPTSSLCISISDARPCVPTWNGSLGFADLALVESPRVSGCATVDTPSRTLDFERPTRFRTTRPDPSPSRCDRPLLDVATVGLRQLSCSAECRRREVARASVSFPLSLGRTHLPKHIDAIHLGLVLDLNDAHNHGPACNVQGCGPRDLPFRSFLRARSMEPINAASSQGLVRNDTAPARRARARASFLGKAVTKMTGV